MVKQFLFVGIGGALGSMLRYLTSVATLKYAQHSFPIATLITNILGCLLMGLLMGYFTQQTTPNQQLKLILITGFCGGYTTFSAFAAENILLFQNQQYLTVFLYTFASLSFGLLAVALGLWISKGMSI